MIFLLVDDRQILVPEKYAIRALRINRASKAAILFFIYFFLKTAVDDYGRLRRYEDNIMCFDWLQVYFT